MDGRDRKSLREALDDWVLKELTGHYVNYRKLASPSMDRLLAEDRFRLYAISTRFPGKLQGQVELTRRSEGIYDVQRGTDQIRLIVLSQIPREPRNAPWLLFSGVAESVQYGRSHFRYDTGEMGAVLQDLLSLYRVENVPVTYTLEDYRKELINRLTEEELAQSPLVRKLREEAKKEQQRAKTAELRASENLDRGELVGQIHMCQKLLGEPLTDRSKLLKKSDEELRELAEESAQRLS